MAVSYQEVARCGEGYCTVKCLRLSLWRTYVRMRRDCGWSRFATLLLVASAAPGVVLDEDEDGESGG